MIKAKRSYTVYQVNSFSKENFSGNPAGVVPDAQGLNDEEMQLIARELKNSETAFIFPPQSGSSDYDVEVRFFTSKTEVPICGHVTIAAHYVLAVEHKIVEGNIVRQKTKAGIAPVRIERVADSFRVVMTQGQISYKSLTPYDENQILDALGLERNDLTVNYPIEIVSTGHSKVLIPVATKKKLNSMAPNFSRLKESSSSIDCNGYYVFTTNTDDKSVLTTGRMFAPAIGIDEDPVTGMANGPLGAYLVKNKLVEHDGRKFSFAAKQGEAMNRAGTMNVVVSIQNDQPIKIEIVGEAVIVFKTSIQI